MGSPREASNSPVYQGEDEEIAYEFEFENWGTPVGATQWNTLKDESGTDHTATNVTGAPAIIGTTIVTGVVDALTAGVKYRLEVGAEFDDGNTYEAYTWIIAEE